MKKLLSILLSIAVLLCCAVPFCADTVYRYGDWTLGVVSGAEDYGGFPIIRIDGYAFATNTKVQQVILTDPITSIGAGAFSQCGSLTGIVIPDTVTQIADDAFQDCDQVVIYGLADSYAITYAIDHNIAYVVIDALTYVLGDADGSGTVTVVDATFLMRAIARLDTPFSEQELLRGDVDRNGVIDATDVTAIRRYLVRLEVLYPIGESVTNG